MVDFLVVPQTQVHLERMEHCDECVQRVDGMSIEFQFSAVSFQSRHTMLSGVDAIRGIDRRLILMFLFSTIVNGAWSNQGTDEKVTAEPEETTQDVGKEDTATAKDHRHGTPKTEANQRELKTRAKHPHGQRTPTPVIRNKNTGAQHNVTLDWEVETS